MRSSQSIRSPLSRDNPGCHGGGGRAGLCRSRRRTDAGSQSRQPRPARRVSGRDRRCLNAPTRNETIKELHRTIDVPIVVTVLSEDEDIRGAHRRGCQHPEHIRSRQNAAGRAQHQGALSGYSDNRDRRSDGGEHNHHRRSGSERDNLDSPVKRRCVQRHYGQVPPRRTPPGFLIESAARRDTPSGCFCRLLTFPGVVI